MVAPGFLQTPRVREWLNGIEPAWTLLDFDSFNALRHEPSRDKRAIRLSSRLSRHSASTVPLHGHLSRVSWKLSRTVLRGGAAVNGGSLLDKMLDAKTKPPYAITMKDRSLFGFARLWERWKDKASGEVS